MFNKLKTIRRKLPLTKLSPCASFHDISHLTTIKNASIKVASIIAFVCFLLITISAYPQTSWHWVKGSSNPKNDFCRSVITDKSHNVYIGGEFIDTVSFDSQTIVGQSASNENGFVAKYDANGNVIFAIGITSPYRSYVTSIDRARDGNIIVGGYFFNQVTIGSTTFYGSSIDAFLSKIDSNGNHMWTRLISSSSDDYVFGINVNDKNGRICVTGSFRSSALSIGGCATCNVVNPREWRNYMYVAEFDSNGNARWIYGGGGTENDYGIQVEYARNGSILVAGHSDSPIVDFGGSSEHNKGMKDPFFLRLDSSGNHVWSRFMGGPGDENVQGLTTDTSGNMYVVGEYSGQTVIHGTDTLNSGSLSDDDVFVAKFDSSGNLQWSISEEGGGGTDQAGNVVVDINENIYLSLKGKYLFTPSIGLKHFDRSGSLVNEYWIIGDGKQTEVASITYDDVGRLTVVGNFYSSFLVYDSDTLYNSADTIGVSDIFVARSSVVIPLPLSVLSFSYKSGHLNWVIKTPYENSVLSLQKLSDEGSWETVTSFMYSKGTHQTRFTDVLNSTYYRLVLNYNSAKSTSHVIYAPAEKIEGAIVYPNPTTHRNSIGIKNLNHSWYDITILNKVGANVYHKAHEAQNGIVKIDDIYFLPKGMYTIRIKGIGTVAQDLIFIKNE